MNVRKAYEIGNILLENGFAPYIPHSTHFWHMLFPKPWSYWLELDKEFLLICDAIYRINGESKGADLEIEFAKEYDIPQFDDITKLCKHFNL